MDKAQSKLAQTAGNSEHVHNQAADKEELSFEQAMDKLEEIVTQLENGEVPLEKAIGLFQEGMEMSRMCSEKLDQIERKVEMLVEENGAIGRKSFPVAMDEGEAD